MRIVVVYMHITLFTNILTLECMLGHQSLVVCELSDPMLMPDYPSSVCFNVTVYTEMDFLLYPPC